MSLLFFQQLKKRSKKKPPPDASTAKTALRSAAQKKLARIGGMRYFGIRGQGVVGSLKLHRCSDSFLCGRCTSGGFLTPRLLRAEGSGPPSACKSAEIRRIRVNPRSIPPLFFRRRVTIHLLSLEKCYTIIPVPPQSDRR